MFGLNSGNCLSALGFVEAADMMNYLIVHKYFLIWNLLQSYGRGGHYGALNTSFGRFQTEYLEVDKTAELNLCG